MKNTQISEVEKIRHSLAHLLAASVLELWPSTKIAIGPTVENGFYYDFDFAQSISDSDLEKIEKKMKQILSTWDKFEKITETKESAQARYAKNEYKKELTQEITDKKEEITSYKSGNFIDLCRGGHVKSAKEIKPDSFKLTHVAGAYWRGDEKNPMLTRIYGVAFETKKELNEYLAQVEEAKKRDHKKLGKELGLFVNSELVGAGLPLFTPKGTVVWQELRKFSDNLKKEAGYLEVHIPHIAKPDLYKTSGHLEKFADDVFYVKGKDSEFIIKPMNCPHHTQIYASQIRSYRDMPIKYFETTTVYRDEKAGELGGLTRVRSITQDDSHAFAREDQVEEVFDVLIKGVLQVVKALKLDDYRIDLSLRDTKDKKSYLGDDATWERAQKEMKEILKKNKVKHEIAEGEAAFYGPKMDFVINDSLGREWQIATIQLDLNMPSLFGLQYIDKSGTKKTPIMVHSAFLGSIERFMGIIIEHFAGAFPIWLSPDQVWVVPVSDKFNTYGKKVMKQLQEAGIRADICDASESLGKKIRNGETNKLPYLLIVGEKEKKAESVAVRSREKGDAGTTKIEKFIEKVSKEIEEKK